MAQSTLADIEVDHRHWLQEIDRWQNFLGTWRQEQDELLDGAARFQQRLKQYFSDLQAYAETLESHRQEIAGAERTMLEQQSGAATESPLLDRHASIARHHEALAHLHQRLQQRYHTFGAQLAMLNHEPCHDD